MSSVLDEQFRLDQPRSNDLVGDPLLIAGMGGGFEGTIDVRVLDGSGQMMLETFVTSTNLASAWQASLTLPDPIPTTGGVVQVGPSTGADERLGMVSVPVIFGPAVIPDYGGYFLYTVQQGDTLSAIATAQAPLYSGTGWQPIFEANQHIISDPNRIYPGMVLRLPSNM